jgi:hypothetical protein
MIPQLFPRKVSLEGGDQVPPPSEADAPALHQPDDQQNDHRDPGRETRTVMKVIGGSGPREGRPRRPRSENR